MSSRFPRSRPLACALAVGLLSACRTEADVAAQKSAARVARAVEVLRQAPNEAKSAPLAELRKLGCAAPDVCAAREQCAAAYALHLDGLALTGAARAKLAEDRATEAARLLGSAERTLKDAEQRIADCTASEGELRRKYKL